jgi:hypothetical protein
MTGSRKKIYDNDPEHDRSPSPVCGNMRPPARDSKATSSRSDKCTEVDESDQGYESRDRSCSHIPRSQGLPVRRSKSTAKRSKQCSNQLHHEDNINGNHRHDRKSKVVGEKVGYSKAVVHDDASDEEIIAIQRPETIEFENIGPEWQFVLCSIFGDNEESLERVCQKGWVKWDIENDLPHLDQKIFDLYERSHEKRWEFVLENNLEKKRKKKQELARGERIATTKLSGSLVPKDPLAENVAAPKIPFNKRCLGDCGEPFGCNSCQGQYYWDDSDDYY